MRVGKNVEHLKEAGRVSSAKSMDPVLRYCAVGRQLGYFTYLTLDSIHYLDAAKIYPMEKATSQRIVKTAQKAWLTGIFLNILSSGYSLYHLGLKREKANKLLGEGKVEEKRIEKEAYETRMQLLCDLCDFVIPASALGLVTVDEGVVGMAGTISSLIGLRGVWRKTAGGA